VLQPLDKTPHTAEYRPPLGPDQVEWIATIGPLSRDDIQGWLDSKGPTRSVLHVWECMLALTNDATDSMFVGAYMHFIASDEALEALDDWAAESRYAESLGLLGEIIRSDWRVRERLLPFGADQRVAKRMAKQLGSQYLAAAAAVRRPPGKERLAGFFAKVKALCLVHAIEALDSQGLTHEQNLMQVCTALRIACDSLNQPQLDWFEKVIAWGTSLSDFSQSLDASCQAALRSGSCSVSERRLFSSLITVAYGGPWIRLERYSSAKLAFPGAFGWHSPPAAAGLLWIAGGDEGNEPVWTQTAEGESLQVHVQSANPVQTLERNRRDGAGVLIETVEAVQLLRHSWHHLTRDDEDALFVRIGELLASETLADRLGSTYVLTAIIACLPWSAVGSVTISEAPCDDWRFAPLTWELRRRAPRFARGWRADEVASEWVRPLAGQLRLRLPEESTAALRDAAGQSPPFDLAGLWARACPPDLTLEGWFEQALAAGGRLNRLTGPALAHVLLVALHERRPNQAFARLMGSRARTGLPSACAYGGYSSIDVADAYAMLKHRIQLEGASGRRAEAVRS